MSWRTKLLGAVVAVTAALLLLFWLNDAFINTFADTEAPGSDFGALFTCGGELSVCYVDGSWLYPEAIPSQHSGRLDRLPARLNSAVARKKVNTTGARDEVCKAKTSFERPLPMSNCKENGILSPCTILTGEKTVFGLAIQSQMHESPLRFFVSSSENREIRVGGTCKNKRPLSLDYQCPLLQSVERIWGVKVFTLGTDHFLVYLSEISPPEAGVRLHLIQVFEPDGISSCYAISSQNPLTFNIIHTVDLANCSGAPSFTLRVTATPPAEVFILMDCREGLLYLKLFPVESETNSEEYYQRSIMRPFPWKDGNLLSVLELFEVITANASIRTVYVALGSFAAGKTTILRLCAVNDTLLTSENIEESFATAQCQSLALEENMILSAISVSAEPKTAARIAETANSATSWTVPLASTEPIDQGKIALNVFVRNRGILRFPLGSPSCGASCNFPTLSNTPQIILGNDDGISGDYNVNFLDPAVGAMVGDFAFFLQPDGLIRYTNASTALEDKIRSSTVIGSLFAADLFMGKGFAHSTRTGEILMTNWAGRRIHKILNNRSVLGEEVVSALSGNPFDICTGGNLAFWSEPAQGRLFGALVDDGYHFIAPAVMISGYAAAGLDYQSTNDRIYVATPDSGSILSFSMYDLERAALRADTSLYGIEAPSSASASGPLSNFSNMSCVDAPAVAIAPPLTEHFRATAFDGIASLLRPLSIAAEPTGRFLFFSVLSSPNLSALDLPGSFEDFSIPDDRGFFKRVPPETTVSPDASATDLASTVWYIDLISQADSGVMEEPQPFYTNPETIVHHLSRHKSWLVFVEESLNGSKPGRIGRFPSDEKPPGVLSAEDAQTILTVGFAGTKAAFAPVGENYFPVTHSNLTKIAGRVALVLLCIQFLWALKTAIQHQIRKKVCLTGKAHP